MAPEIGSTLKKACALPPMILRVSSSPASGSVMTIWPISPWKPVMVVNSVAMRVGASLTFLMSTETSSVFFKPALLSTCTVRLQVLLLPISSGDSKFGAEYMKH